MCTVWMDIWVPKSIHIPGYLHIVYLTCLWINILRSLFLVSMYLFLNSFFQLYWDIILTHVPTKQEISFGKGTRVESRRVREPRRTVLPCGSKSRFMVMGLVFGGLWPIILIQSLSWWCTHHSAKMDASERDSGKWMDMQCLLSAFPELFQLVVAY